MEFFRWLDRDRFAGRSEVLFENTEENACDVCSAIRSYYCFAKGHVDPSQSFEFTAKVGMFYLVDVLAGSLSYIWREQGIKALLVFIREDPVHAVQNLKQ